MDPKVKKEIEDIIDLFNRSNLGEFEIEKEGLRLRLRKDIPAISVDSTGTAANPAIEKETEKSEKTETEEDLIPIKTPMVGTFYQASSPEAAPFVEEGDIVEPEQVVCIIEAMKLMNEIKAESRGRIAKILVEDGHPVEYGQTLFLVKAE